MRSFVRRYLKVTVVAKAFVSAIDNGRFLQNVHHDGRVDVYFDGKGKNDVAECYVEYVVWTTFRGWPRSLRIYRDLRIQGSGVLRGLFSNRVTSKYNSCIRGDYY